MVMQQAEQGVVAMTTVGMEKCEPLKCWTEKSQQTFTLSTR